MGYAYNNFRCTYVSVIPRICTLYDYRRIWRSVYEVGEAVRARGGTSRWMLRMEEPQLGSDIRGGEEVKRGRNSSRGEVEE